MLYLGSQFGLHILACLRETGEDSERQRRVGEIVGVLDMDIGSARVEDTDGREHWIGGVPLGQDALCFCPPMKKSTLALSERLLEDERRSRAGRCKQCVQDRPRTVGRAGRLQHFPNAGILDF